MSMQWLSEVKYVPHGTQVRPGWNLPYPKVLIFNLHTTEFLCNLDPVSLSFAAPQGLCPIRQELPTMFGVATATYVNCAFEVVWCTLCTAVHGRSACSRFCLTL